ncbi:MAG: hypothetical protein ACYC6W_11145 [Nitrosotalea sp.]
MVDSQITAVAGIVIVVIGVIVGGMAMTAVWSVPNQIVQNSESQQLQATYHTGKEMIDIASNTQDTWNFVKSVSLLVGLPSVGYLAIRVITNIDFN